MNDSRNPRTDGNPPSIWAKAEHEQFASRVTFVTVTYNSERVIEDCLRAVPAAARLILVDNASTDRTVELGAAQRPDMNLYRLRRNAGYGRANNFALRKVETEFALLLNPDAQIAPAALSALLRAAAANPGYALLAPELTTGPEAAEAGGVERSPVIEPQATVIGAIMLIRMEAGRAVGFFDESFFLYCEDLDFCARMREAGWGIGTVKGVTGYHRKNSSTTMKPGLQLRKYILQGRSVAHLRRKARNSRLWRLHCLRKTVEHAFKALAYLLMLNPDRMGRHVGRSVGAFLYMVTSSTGPEFRPEVVSC